MIKSVCKGMNGTYEQHSVLKDDVIESTICHCPVKVGCKHVAAQLMLFIGGKENIKSDYKSKHTSHSGNVTQAVSREEKGK